MTSPSRLHEEARRRQALSPALWTRYVDDVVRLGVRPFAGETEEKEAALSPSALKRLKQLEGSHGGTFADGVEESAKEHAGGTACSPFDGLIDLEHVEKAEREWAGRCARCSCDAGDCECPGGPKMIDSRKRAALLPGVQLREHQQKAVDKYDQGSGGMLFSHEVGTGKTLTSIAAIERAREKGRAGVTLAVTPAALRDNFIDNGVHAFTDRKAVRLGGKGEKGSHHVGSEVPKADYYVVSMEMFRKDPHAYMKRTGADTLVVDELHKARDPESENYKALMAARGRVKNFIGLTGTPVMNHPRDVVPIMDIVTNGRHDLGKYHKPALGKAAPRGTFDERFMGYETKAHGPLGFLGIGPRSTVETIKRPRELREALAPHVHYASTEELGGAMPEKHVHDVDVEMSGHQRALYDFAMDKVDPHTRWKIRMNLPVGSSEAQHVFKTIAQARQASNALHPLDRHHTPLSSAANAPKPKRVVEDVLKHLDEHQSHKAIIYTNLVHGGVDQMMAGLKARGHEPGLFIGSGHQKRSERDQHVKDYLAGKRRVMIINQAGTEGLNLPGTTAHFTLDPHFNPMVTQQAEARGIRAGSPVDKVNVYRYKSVLPHPWNWKMMPRETSADEWIYGIADRKEKLNQQFTGLMR